MSNKYLCLLTRFFLLSQTFLKISKIFCSFSSQISHFSTPVGIVAATIPVKMGKDSQIDFFCSFLFDQMF